MQKIVDVNCAHALYQQIITTRRTLRILPEKSGVTYYTTQHISLDVYSHIPAEEISVEVKISQRKTKSYATEKFIFRSETFSRKICEKNADERIPYYSLLECFRKGMFAWYYRRFFLFLLPEKLTFCIRNAPPEITGPHNSFSPGLCVSSFLSHFKRRCNACACVCVCVWNYVGFSRQASSNLSVSNVPADNFFYPAD